jgi:hypothetical protein
MAETQDGQSKQTVTFHYLKSPDFRTIHADGIIGGITPQGILHGSLWAQRAPIPREVTMVVEPDGKLGQEVARVGRDGVVRELQVDVMFNLAAALEIRDWLDKQIEQLEKLNEHAARK